MSKKERLIYFYDLKITASSRGFKYAKTITAYDAMQLISTIPASEMHCNLNDLCHIYVSKFEWVDGDILTILINRSDQNVPNPIFSKFSTQSRREIKKDRHEGQDYSAHIVIKFSTDRSEPALVLIEKNYGLSVSVIKKLFDTLLKNAESITPKAVFFTQNHPDGSMDKEGRLKTYNVSFRSDFLGHVSDSLRDDLNKGTLQSIELITEVEQPGGLDEECYLEEKKSVVILKLNQLHQPVRDKFAAIVNYLSNKKFSYDFGKIRFKTVSGLNRQIDIEQSAADTLYVKREKINDFSVDLESSYSDFNNEIIDKMKELVD